MAILDDLLNKLDRVQKEVPKRVLPKIEPMMKLSLNQAMADWYGSYEGVYQRTGNFISVAHNPIISYGSDSITMTVSSDTMHDYPGIYSPLGADTAFAFMYMHGEHGHGRFQAAVSVPPDMLVSRDVESGFNGQVQALANAEVAKILG